MKKYSNTLNKQSGFTLIEMAFALIIFGIMAAIVAPIVSSTMSATEADAESKMTQSYYAGLKAKWRRGPYTGLNNAFVINAQIPDPSAVSGTTITNGWGGSVVFAAGTITGGVASGAKQITNPVPPAACMAYATAMAPFVDELIVGSTTVKAVGGTINPATSATACNVTTATVNVIMRKA